MNRSGRSVAEASRVIEIEEVLEASSVPGAKVRLQLLEDRLLDLFVLGRRLDGQVRVADLRQVRRPV